MASRGIFARAGLIGAVAVIVGVSTLAPLLKETASMPDLNPPVALVLTRPVDSIAPEPTVAARLPETLPIVTPASAAVPDDKPPPAAPAAAPTQTTTATATPSDVSAFPAPQPLEEVPRTAAAEPPPEAPPIVAATEPPKAEPPRAAGHVRAAKKTVRRQRPNPTPFSYSQQLAAH